MIFALNYFHSDDYYVEEACQQLLDAYLAQMILDLMASLGCE